ncbi:MAG: hypothetical protein HZC37_20730 [Burkholderiales bacterium]|nr:hypothetical protein [Burkholderiales bacterium]
MNADPAGQASRATSGVRWAVVVTATFAAVAVVALSAWWLLQPSRDSREGVRLHAEAQNFPWSRAPAGTEAAPLGAPPAAAAAPPSPAAAGPAAFDLCGLGRIVVPASAPERDGGDLAGLPAPVGRFPLQEAQARLLQTLSAGDAKLRVAARLLQQPADVDPAAEASWARGLLADAMASRDAQALRWAGAACPFVDDELGCRQRLARARVQAEPANALHWLDWANEEPEAADAAWAGLARAQYWREQPLGLAGLLLRAVPADVPGYLMSTLAVDAMSRDVAFPAPPLSLALQRCPARVGGSGSASAGECERLARLLVERGDSVQALMLGRELGEHIGWAAPQLQRLDEEVDLLQKQEHHWSVDERRPLGCETVDSQRSHIAAVEREGELAVLRRNLAVARAPR